MEQQHHSEENPNIPSVAGKCCSYKHPVAPGFRCPFEAVSEFEGNALCFFHEKTIRTKEHLKGHDITMLLELIRKNKICSLPEWNAPGISLEYATLNSVEIFRTDVSYANFMSSILDGAKCGFSNFSFAKFNLARINSARFSNTKFSSSDFTGSDLSHSYFSKCIFTKAKLNRARFFAADIRNSDFSNANGGTSDFSSAKLSCVKFNSAHLQGARFRFAVLDNVDFTNADLRKCDFTGAVITNPTLVGAMLTDSKGMIIS